MSRQQQVYADFSGGFNDSVAAISIKDTEVCVSENADYSAEIKSFKTRKGTAKVNETSFGKEVTDGYVWSIGATEKKCLVMNGKVYDFAPGETPELTEKITLTAGATRIYPFVLYNTLYFGDGSEIYSWGGYDFSSEEGTVTVAADKIVRNNTSPNGTLGHFYKAKNNRGSIDLGTETYTNATNWTDVTEVPYFASSVVRPIDTYDPSQKEKVRVTVISGAENAGTITLHLDNSDFTCEIEAASSVATIVNALYEMTTTGWSKVKESNTVVFTKDVVGISGNGYVDPGETGSVMTYVTEQEGSINDNNLDPIKKCTMFVVHTASYRIFAAGNPDDNAVFYSEIGNPAYFKSDYNKVYAVNGYGKPTGMLQLSESILISFERGWYAWSGVTPLEDATWKQLNIPYGCVSNDSIVLTPYSFIFLANDGIYNISAAILNSEIFLLQGKDIIEKISRSKVDNTIASIDDLSKCKGIFYNNVYYLAYNRNVSDGNTRVLKFEWDTSSFTEVTGWKVNAWLADSKKLYFATTNYLLEANVGENDIDVATGEEKPINLYIKTKEYSFGNPFTNKVVNLIGFIFKQSDDADNEARAHIRIITGYSKYDIDTVNISESLIYGRNWGLLWGFREAVTKMVELTLSSDTYQIEIRNNSLNSPITLVAIGFVYEVTDFLIPTLLKDEVLLK